MTKNFAIRKTDKAAKVYAKRTGDILVRFPAGMGGGKYTAKTLRYARPIITRTGNVGVRVKRGIWLVKGWAIKHLEVDGTALRNAEGRAYKASIMFDAEHILWLDERNASGSITPNQLEDEINMFVYRHRNDGQLGA